MANEIASLSVYKPQMPVLKKINLLGERYSNLVPFMFSVLQNLVEFESGLKSVSDAFWLYDVSGWFLFLSFQTGYCVLFSGVSSLVPFGCSHYNWQSLLSAGESQRWRRAWD